MEVFRGDTFMKKFSPKGYTMQKDDVIRMAVLQSTISGSPIWDITIKIDEETPYVILEIPKSDMEKLPIGLFTLEIELTYGGGLVKTEQYEFDVKADGIHG